MKKLELIIDMDQILANLHGKWLPVLNAEFGYSMTVADLSNYNIRQCVPCGEEADKIIGRPNFYLDLEPLPGALDALMEFHEAGHDILIATSPGRHLSCVPDKGVWLAKHAPFLNRRNWMFGSPKFRLTGDLFIDDGPDNITKYRARPQNANAKIATIAHPYNAEIEPLVDLYAHGWEDTAKAWAEIRQYVRALAGG